MNPFRSNSVISPQGPKSVTPPAPPRLPNSLASSFSLATPISFRPPPPLLPVYKKVGSVCGESRTPEWKRSSVRSLAHLPLLLLRRLLLLCLLLLITFLIAHRHSGRATPGVTAKNAGNPCEGGRGSDRARMVTGSLRARNGKHLGSNSENGQLESGASSSHSVE